MNIYCYLDNAATSFPKPGAVLKEVERVVGGEMGNPGRSGHLFSRSSRDVVFNSRVSIAEFLGFDSPENIVFTHNATYALNLSIIGIINAMKKEKPLVLTSVFEHNSVLRPLYRLEREGKIRLKIISPEKDNTNAILSSLDENVSLLVLTLLSNTAGDKFDIEKIGKKAKEFGTYFIVDASQSLGSEPFNIKKSNADIVCAPGHKGLFGILGAGIIAVNENSVLPEAVISGGSGSESRNHFMPEFLPDLLEGGSLALPAIAAVGAGVRFIQEVGINEISSREKELKKRLVFELLNMKNITVYGEKNDSGPILFNSKKHSSEEFADLLDREMIAVRGGFHCAPLAHDFYQTGENGAVRISVGFFTTDAEISYAIDKIGCLSK